MKIFAAWLVVAAALFSGQPASAQAKYPDRPIRMIVTFPPGGPTDSIGRLIAQKVTEKWGQQIVVENIAGGGGNLGMATAARAPADGYTILVVSTGFIINPHLYARAPYKLEDFAPISLVAASPDVLTVHPDVPARSISELISVIKANPGKYSYAHPGLGSTAHLSAELFKLKSGLDIVMVPFGSAGGRAINAVIGGHTQLAITALPPVVPNVKDGKLRALAVLANERNSELPNVPTMAESGIADMESHALTGLVAAAGTPQAVIDFWHQEVVRIVALPEVQEKLKTLGFEAVASTPQNYADRIRKEAAKWSKTIGEAKIKIE
jgi:tripartite-type tricarboxylate transporter receptor subunit TctC